MTFTPGFRNWHWCRSRERNETQSAAQSRDARLRDLSFRLWDLAGRPEGASEYFWREAELILALEYTENEQPPSLWTRLRSTWHASPDSLRRPWKVACRESLQNALCLIGELGAELADWCGLSSPRMAS